MTILDLIPRLGSRRPPATPADIAEAESRLGPLPDDYKEFLRRSNGYEGFPHPNLYLSLFPIKGVVGYNREGTGLVIDHPILIQFGGDGGGEGYFFDSAAPGLVRMIALISNWHTDSRPAGDTFTDFLARQLEGLSPLE